MKILKAIAGILVLLLAGVGVLLTGYFEPFIGFPGGGLTGMEQHKPVDWAFAAEVGTVQLETRPADPYSVNLWGVGVGSDFYVATRPQGTTWSGNLGTDSNVRLRVGEILFPLKAVSVIDAAERGRVHAAYVEKYNADPDQIADSAGLIFRLEPR